LIQFLRFPGSIGRVPPRHPDNHSLSCPGKKDTIGVLDVSSVLLRADLVPRVSTEPPAQPASCHPPENQIAAPTYAAKIDLQTLASILVGRDFEGEARSNVISVIQIPLSNCGIGSRFQDFTKTISPETPGA